ncbi:MAG: methylenetetrahydrofolate reductase [Thermodesulfobacteriota bacterium]
MNAPPSRLKERIASGKPVLLAEIHPPQGGDPASWRAAAGRFAGKVHAVGVSDNRERVAMSALAAASLLKADGIEPILHVNTRDRNRIALVSEALGAQALGIANLLCTSGDHQTLGGYRAAKNVHDIDSVQLLQAYARLSSDAGLVGEESLPGAGPFLLGAVASPDADPPALQMMRLAKKVRAGARFLVTQPVCDPERFEAWWKEIVRRGLHEQAAVLAGIRPSGAAETALETVRRLSKLPGIRGFCISADGDPEAALRIVEESGLSDG